MTAEWTPSRIWMGLPHDLRSLAARGYDWKSPETRRDAELAIARSLRFREIFVRKLPLEKRIAYLASAVRPDDALAASLLVALHITHRRPMLATFLDTLGIPHEDGVITAGHEPPPPGAEALADAARTLDTRFPEAEVTLYLKTLLAIDPETWAGLREIAGARASS